MPNQPESDLPANIPESSAPAPGAASLLEDFIDVFYAPSTVFARRRNSGFWPYFLILSVLAAVFTLASRSVMTAAMDAEFSRRMTKMMADNPRLTEDIVAQQRGMTETFGMVFLYLGMPILIFFVGLLIWVGARVVSAKITFDRAMLISCIAQIPRLAGALLTAIYAVLLGDTSGITGMSKLTWSPARFLDPDTTNPMLLAVLTRVDIFTLWVTVLLGIGVAVIANVPRGKGYAAAAIAWVVATLFTLMGARG